jgi:hypothetical protein
MNMAQAPAIVAFAQARLDEDEADARGFRGVFPSPVVFENGDVALHAHREGSAVIVAYSNPREGDGDMQALSQWGRPAGLGWGSARVLAETEAKRLVLARHQPYDDYTFGARCKVCASWEGYSNGVAIMEPWPCLDVLAVIAPYADHPDFKPTWRIEETSGDR